MSIIFYVTITIQIKKLVKNKEFNKETITQLVNRIEVDKDNHAVIYFNF